MLLTQASLLFTILPFTIAATCNSSNALPYTAANSNNNSGSSTQASIDAAFTTCSSSCGSSASCLTNCLSTACRSYCKSKTSSNCQSTCLSDPCSAFYGSGSATPNPDALQACYKAAGNNKLRVRDNSLTCTSSQTCYMETNGNLFCLNTSTGEYTDISGGNGNVNTGSYTSADGSKSTSRSAPTSTGASRAASAPTSSGGSKTTASSSPTAAQALASATKNAGVQNFRANAVLGAFGLVMGFTL